MRFQDCDITKTYDQNERDVMNVLQSIESAFDCVGWCDTTYIWPIYVFSDVNNGKPKVNCYSTMKSKLEEYGSVLEVYSVSVASYPLVSCSLSAFAGYASAAPHLVDRCLTAVVLWLTMEDTIVPFDSSIELGLLIN